MIIIKLIFLIPVNLGMNMNDSNYDYLCLFSSFFHFNCRNINFTQNTYAYHSRNNPVKIRVPLWLIT